ncbi:MAG: hypothetical protein GWO24_31735 [Akkermansiaceae bacterium]|nr:hypothetical protein [Akkermansiaceae bacterium]
MLTDPTTLQVFWTGGEGPYTIQASTTGETGSWTDAKTGVASSPTTIGVDPSGVPTLLVRVIEP